MGPIRRTSTCPPLDPLTELRMKFGNRGRGQAQCRKGAESHKASPYDPPPKNPVYQIFEEHTRKERQHLEMLFTSLVDKGEGSSAIVIGGSGSGKNTFVDSILTKLDSDITTTFLKRRTVVRLNGLICKDLKLCVQAITYALNLEEELSKVIGDGNNFDDRLTEILIFLRESLVSSSSANPVIVILDKIELFCEQVGQALLYNLLDIVQTKQSPLCVIGLTSRVDILELFEKRVKSRFSHRFIHLSPLGFKDYCRLVSKWLEIQGNSNWNLKIVALLNDKFVEDKILNQLYSIDNSLMNLNIFINKVISKCKSEDEFCKEIFTEVLDEMRGSSRVLMAMDLTHTEMLLLLGIQRLTKNGSPAFNFEGIYDLVRKCSAGDSKQDMDKDELWNGFCVLEEYEFIRPIDRSKVDKTELFYKTELTHLEFIEIFNKYPQLPSSFKSLM